MCFFQFSPRPWRFPRLEDLAIGPWALIPVDRLRAPGHRGCLLTQLVSVRSRCGPAAAEGKQDSSAQTQQADCAWFGNDLVGQSVQMPGGVAIRTGRSELKGRLVHCGGVPVIEVVGIVRTGHANGGGSPH